MIPVINSSFKAHITRFTGSMGSGTDGGRRTDCAAGGVVTPTVGPCPRAKGGRHNDRMTRVELRSLDTG
jgi:hypothetical protein